MVFKTTVNDQQGSKGTYIGTAITKWKDGVQLAKDGASPPLKFVADLTDMFSDQLPGLNQIVPTGSIEGRL